MDKPRIYFAHPMSMYGTQEEADIIARLSRAGWDVVNPGSPAIAEAFAAYRDITPDNYMQFFIDLCNDCAAVAFCTFPDGVQADGVPNTTKRVGAGVVTEVESFWARRNPECQVLWYDSATNYWVEVANWDDFTVLDVPQTRALLKAIKPDYRSATKA